MKQKLGTRRSLRRAAKFAKKNCEGREEKIAKKIRKTQQLLPTA